MSKALEQLALQLNPSFQACYAPAASRNPTLTGRVVMKLTVEPDGTVSQVEDVTDALGGARAQGPGAHQGLPDQDVRSCVAEVWRKARLSDPPARQVSFTWPTFFMPSPREQVDEELRPVDRPAR